MTHLTLAYVLVALILSTLAWGRRSEYQRWREQPIYSKIFLTGLGLGAVLSVLLAIVAVAFYLYRLL